MRKGTVLGTVSAGVVLAAMALLIQSTPLPAECQKCVWANQQTGCTACEATPTGPYRTCTSSCEGICYVQYGGGCGSDTNVPLTPAGTRLFGTLAWMENRIHIPSGLMADELRDCAGRLVVSAFSPTDEQSMREITTDLTI